MTFRHFQGNIFVVFCALQETDLNTPYNKQYSSLFFLFMHALLRNAYRIIATLELNLHAQIHNLKTIKSYKQTSIYLSLRLILNPQQTDKT